MILPASRTRFELTRRRTAVDIDEARAFAKQKVDKDITYRHLVSVEGVMRRLGAPLRRGRGHVGADGAVPRPRPGPDGRGPRRHAYLAAGWLREAGVDEVVVNGVLAHAHPEYQTDRMSRAIVAADARRRACWWPPRWSVPRKRRDEGLLRQEEAQGEGVRPRASTARRSRSRRRTSAWAGRVHRAGHRGAAGGRPRDRAVAGPGVRFARKRPVLPLRVRSGPVEAFR